ncbi:hypothetical protein ACOME3_007045 [Neoechinorhynchus agilis]
MPAKFKKRSCSANTIASLVLIILGIALVILVLALLLTDHPTKPEFSWSYNNIDEWKDHFKNCGGKRQSPINIKQVHPNDDNTTIRFHGQSAQTTVIVELEEFTVISIIQDEAKAPRVDLLNRNGFNNRYQFDQFHFHWSDNNKNGSEHQINDTSYPLEMHAVFFNTKYSGDKPLIELDGLLIFSKLFQISNKVSNELASFVELLNDINEDHEVEHTLNILNLLDIQDKLYMYDGSLTTPGCHETATWMVIKNIGHIRPKDMEEFRKLKEKNPQMFPNHRQPQALNERIVKLAHIS